VIQELEAQLEELSHKIESQKPRAPQTIQAIALAADKIVSHKHGKRLFFYQAKEGRLEFGPNEKGPRPGRAA